MLGSSDSDHGYDTEAGTEHYGLGDMSVEQSMGLLEVRTGFSGLIFPYSPFTHIPQ
jgi:hypothetical protein